MAVSFFLLIYHQITVVLIPLPIFLLQAASEACITPAAAATATPELSALVAALSVSASHLHDLVRSNARFVVLHIMVIYYSVQLLLFLSCILSGIEMHLDNHCSYHG